MSFLKTKFAKLELYMFHQCLKNNIELLLSGPFLN